MRGRFATSFVMVLGLVGGACDSDEEACAGPQILPHMSPIRLAPFRPLGQGETPDPGSPDKVPYEFALFLQSTCSAPLTITEVCIVGDAHNGDEDEQAFAVEGPVPETVTQGQSSAVRITYDHARVNEDLDDDGERDPDNVALVVQSNAKNFPTLIVPICAMIIPGNEEPIAFVCSSPVTVPAGDKDLTLCP